MNTTGDIETGSDVCPSCKSDDWKSAKMVVMEGTTNTSGTLSGTVTDPGAFSGGMKEFLLSDRWFSWDYPIEAKIGLTSSTGLVEEVKRLMVDHASALQMPLRPIDPMSGSFIKELKIGETLRYIFSSKYLEYLLYVFFAAFIALGARVIYLLGGGQSDVNGVVISFIAITSLITFGMLYLGKKMCIKAEKAMPAYKEQLAEYEAEKSNVMKARELLWEQARICTRCGKAYLGGN